MVELADTQFASERAARSDLDYLSISSQWMVMRAFFRGVGNSGFLNIRQYSAAGDTVEDNRFTVGYRPLNAHNHSNYKYLCGMSERQGMANGYPYGSRHTDYNLNTPVAGNYLATERVTFPTVPASVTGTVAQQVTEMQNYFQALVDKDHSVYDYRTHFTWVLSVEEVWPEVFAETLEDTFDSDRHTVDASSIQEQTWKHWRDEQGGIMGRGENINVWPIVPFVTSETGTPELATIKNRVTCHVVGNLGDYHFDDLLSPRADLYGERRAGSVPPAVGSDKLRHRVNTYSGSSTATVRSIPGLLDELMTKCYGIEAAGTLTETYYDKTSDADFNVFDWGTTNNMNAAKFSRFVGIGIPNASGRTDRRRGFNDSNFFAALTNNPNVIGVSDGVRQHRYSWGLPMELVMLNPLMSWNPHGVPLKADPTEGGTLDGLTAGTAYSGYREDIYHYLTPDEFYNGTDPEDPADTSSARWVKDSGGTSRLCRTAGPWMVLPPIDNVTSRVRGRYFIYEDAIQSPAMAQALALRV